MENKEEKKPELPYTSGIIELHCKASRHYKEASLKEDLLAILKGARNAIAIGNSNYADGCILNAIELIEKSV